MLVANLRVFSLSWFSTCCLSHLFTRHFQCEAHNTRRTQEIRTSSKYYWKRKHPFNVTVPGVLSWMKFTIKFRILDDIALCRERCGFQYQNGMASESRRKECSLASLGQAEGSQNSLKRLLRELWRVREEKFGHEGHYCFYHQCFSCQITHL